jgi:hypothetical protein
MAGESLMILEMRANNWQWTNCIRFQMLTGRTNVFAIELPESVAARVEVRSIPTASTRAGPPVEGRITLQLHTDEPAGDQFVVVLTTLTDLAGAIWQLPAVGLPGVEQTATMLVVPDKGLEPVDADLPVDSFDVPEWAKTIMPAVAPGSPPGLAPGSPPGPGWKTYRWSGAAPAARFRAKRDGLSKAGVDTARIDLWLDAEGSIEGWLGLKLSEHLPEKLELAWPNGAHPTALYVAGEYLAPPAAESGGWAIPLPTSAKGGLVWLSWSSPRHPLPVLSARLAAQVPWPQNVPVDQSTVKVHSPPYYRIEPAPPLVAMGSGSQAPALPALICSAEERTSSRDAEISLAVAPDSGPVAKSGVGYELGSKLRIVSEWPRQLLLASLAALLVSAVCWKTAPFWSWLTQHETSAWLALAAIWYLWLDPDWFGLVLALWAIARALVRRDRVGEPGVGTDSMRIGLPG